MQTAEPPPLELPPLYPAPRQIELPDDELGRILAEVDALADELEAHPFQPIRDRQHLALRGTWSPWWIQRMVLRSYALGLAAVFVIIAGRQSGKTEVAVYLLLLVALERPNSYSILLAPNYIIALTAVGKIKARACDIPGLEWKEQKKQFHLPNGAVIQVFSADRPEKVGRGPTLDGVLYTDEAAFVSERARDATLGALTAVSDPIKLFASTPKGRNWLYREHVAVNPEEKKESWRFRSADSPYANLKEIAANRKRMGAEMAAQEYDAEFLDSILLVFPDPGTMFVDTLKPRAGRGHGNVLGIDVAKHQDWTVVTLMNRWGEGRILARFQKPEKGGETFYDDALKRFKKLLDVHAATACIDTANSTGPGEALADMLVAAKYPVLRVRTGQDKDKARCIERTQVAYQQGDIRLLRNEHSDQAIHELGQYMSLSRAIKGRQVNAYQGPQEDGEFDDCVISICLAYWGIFEADEAPVKTPLKSLSRGPSKHKRRAGSGYMF